MAFAKKYGIDGLNLPELRMVMNDVLNLNIAEGTWTSYLATAPATEILKVTGDGGKKVYRLVKDGHAAWESAVEKAQTNP